MNASSSSRSLAELEAALRGRFRHIAVEGPIGVGKSSLARALAASLQAQLLLELPEENPFLEKFYADGTRYAFQAQMFFLFQRVEQYRQLAEPDMFAHDAPGEAPRSGSGTLVADFMFEKDGIFARLTLDEHEYRLYRQIHEQLAPRALQPDLVVWLRAAPPVLLQRIRQRGIGMEQGIDAAYLQRLCDAYARFFDEGAGGLRVLTVDTENFNPVQRPADYAAFLERLADIAEGRRVSMTFP